MIQSPEEPLSRFGLPQSIYRFQSLPKRLLTTRYLVDRLSPTSFHEQYPRSLNFYQVLTTLEDLIFADLPQLEEL